MIPGAVAGISPNYHVMSATTSILHVGTKPFRSNLICLMNMMVQETSKKHLNQNDIPKTFARVVSPTLLRISTPFHVEEGIWFPPNPPPKNYPLNSSKVPCVYPFYDFNGSSLFISWLLWWKHCCAFTQQWCPSTWIGPHEWLRFLVNGAVNIPVPWILWVCKYINI